MASRERRALAEKQPRDGGEEAAAAYCTVEQCHAIVNAAIAQFTLDMERQLAATANGGAKPTKLALVEAEPEPRPRRRSLDSSPRYSSGDEGSHASPSARSGLGAPPRLKARQPRQRTDDGASSGSAQSSPSLAAAAAPDEPVALGDAVFLSGYSPDILAVGVLKKWVNYAHGWESRVVVLDAGVIRYFSTKGKNAVSLAALMRDRECYKIGDRIDKIRRKQAEMDSFQDNPLGEMHISVARIRLSKADATKFRIFTGIKKGGKGNFGWRGALQLRAESSADRQRWINILKVSQEYYQTKDRLEGASAATPTADVDDDFAQLESQLQGLNAPASVLEVCRVWAEKKKEAHEEELQKEREELLDMQDEMRNVLEEKRYLEDTILSMTSASVDGDGRKPRSRARAGSVSDDEAFSEDDSGRDRRGSHSSRHSSLSGGDDEEQLESAEELSASRRSGGGLTRPRSLAALSPHALELEPEPEPEPEPDRAGSPSRDSIDSDEAFFDVNAASPGKTAAAKAAAEAAAALRQKRKLAAARSLIMSPRLQIPVPARERKVRAVCSSPIRE